MPTPFTVMTWNVENLFPPGSFTGPNSPPVAQADFEAKIDTLSNFILGFAEQPDIIALQEVGGQNDADMRSFDALQQALGGIYDNRAVSGEPDSRHIRVAFISKLPLLNPADIKDFPSGPMESVRDFNSVRTAMGRGALKVEVEPLPGVRVRLVTTHLKSKLLTFPRPGGGTSFSTQDEDIRAFAAGIALHRRAAEAVTVRAFLTAEMEADPTMHTIVLGDMNDGPLAATSQVFLGPADADIKSDDQFDSVRLFNLVDAVPVRGPFWHTFLDEAQAPHFTRIHDGRGEVLDHIMASKKLIVPDSEFAVEVRIFNELTADQNVGYNPTARLGVAVPDHAPVMARFELPD